MLPGVVLVFAGRIAQKVFEAIKQVFPLLFGVFAVMLKLGDIPTKLKCFAKKIADKVKRLILRVFCAIGSKLRKLFGGGAGCGDDTDDEKSKCKIPPEMKNCKNPALPGFGTSGNGQTSSSDCGYKIVYTNPTNPDCTSQFPNRPYGIMLDYDIISIKIPGLSYDEAEEILAKLEGKKLTETVTTDNGCNTGQPRGNTVR